MKRIFAIVLAVAALSMLVLSGCSSSQEVTTTTSTSGADATAESNDAEFDGALLEIEDLENLNSQMESDYSTEEWDSYLSE